MADGQLGKVALVKSSHIQRLDDLASEAVKKIKFVPMMVNRSPVGVFKQLEYSYSWRYGGWRGSDLPSEQSCKPKPIKAKTKRSKSQSNP